MGFRTKVNRRQRYTADIDLKFPQSPWLRAYGMEVIRHPVEAP
jgi:hypothetical protein